MDEKCVKRVYDYGGFHTHQCHRNAWKDGWCKQHHPDTVKARNEKSELSYREKLKQSPWYKLEQRSNELKSMRLIADGVVKEWDAFAAKKIVPALVDSAIEALRKELAKQ